MIDLRRLLISIFATATGSIVLVLLQLVININPKPEKIRAKEQHQGYYVLFYPRGFSILGVIGLIIAVVFPAGMMIWQEGTEMAINPSVIVFFAPLLLLMIACMIFPFTEKTQVHSDYITVKSMFHRAKIIQFCEISYGQMVFQLGMWRLALFMHGKKKAAVKLDFYLYNMSRFKDKLQSCDIQIIDDSN